MPSQQRVPVSDSFTQEGTKTDQSLKEKALGIAPRISNASAASMWTTRSPARPLDDELRSCMGDSGFQARKAHARLPSYLCSDTHRCLRLRQLAAEECARRSDQSQPVHISNATVNAQSIESDRLDPEQLAQLRALVQEHCGQISWTPDDIGCLTEKYAHLRMQIPTVEGSHCKQRPYKLSHKEI